MRERLLVLLLAALVAPATAWPQSEAETLRAAKALVLDREYAQARRLLQGVRASGRGPDAQSALYWMARCSDRLGEGERALGEYGEFLATRPGDRTLVEEARTSRISLAVKLAKAGKPVHLAVAIDALGDASREVRYFAALQVATLGPEGGRPAVPVLKEILAKEKDDDLVERAKLALLRVDRRALAESVPAPTPRPSARAASWIRVRIFEKGVAKPNVSINLPVALAELVFKSLPDETRGELRRKGYDADNFWDRIKRTGPTEILTIEGDEGERVQIWIE